MNLPLSLSLDSAPRDDRASLIASRRRLRREFGLALLPYGVALLLVLVLGA